MLDRFIAIARLQIELVLLEARIGCHAFQIVFMSQFEHAGVEGVETSQGDKLEFIAHFSQLLLEVQNGLVIQVAAPVEGGRAVIGKPFAGEFFVHSLGKLTRLAEVGFGGFAPDDIGVRGKGTSALDGIFCPAAKVVVAFIRALAGQEGLVDGV